MKNRMIRLCSAVSRLKVADVNYNSQEIIKIIRTYNDTGLIVFPELSVTGYTCGDLFTSILLLNRTEEALLEIAASTYGINGLTVVVGLPMRYRNCLYNCAAVISNGTVRAIVPKSFIPNCSEFYENRWFTPGKNVKNGAVAIGGRNIPFGTDILVFDECSGAVLGIEICEDLWVPDKPSSHACLAGANIIANLSASDELIGKAEYRRGLVSQQSGSCCCAYVYCSSGSGESSTDLVFSGHTIIAQNGKMLAESIFFEPHDVIEAVADLDIIMHDRQRQNTFENKNTNDYRMIPVEISAEGRSNVTISELSDILRKSSFSVSKNPFVPYDSDERGNRCRKILQIQANGLATRVKATGIFNLIIGISGGLDSTLALLVCEMAKKIIPDIRIIAYTMPKEGNTTEHTLSNAEKLMNMLADESYNVPIDRAVRDHLTLIGHSDKYTGESDVTYENAQARIRTLILMDAANMKNGMVIGTGDLSELALGWCTYNGDHMSMYAVNTSVPKTLVKYIVKSYADTCGIEQLRDVLLSVCDTPISPELTPSHKGKIAQKTEEKIGKYDLNDFFLFYTLRYGFTPSKTAAFAMCAYQELPKKDILTSAEKFYKRFFTQQFKRNCLPDGPKIGSVSLSPRGDWRMPSDAEWKLWINDLILEMDK